MKKYDLLDPIQFQDAVESTGLSESVLRAIRFGLAYGRKEPNPYNLNTEKALATIEVYNNYAKQQKVNKSVKEGGNVVRLTDYKFKKSMENFNS